MTEMVLGGLVHSSVRVVLVATLVAAALTVFRAQAVTTRHAAWTVVLVAMLLMPVLSGLVPHVGVPLPAITRGVLMPTAGQPSGLQAPERNPRPLTSAPAAATRRTAAANISPGPVLPEPSREDKRPWAAVALGVYFAGVVVMLLRFALGLRGVWRLTLGRLVDTSTHRRLAAVRVTVRESCRVTAPVTVGFFRPAIVLPSGWRRWSDSTLLAVLAHEAAHAARRDPLVTGLASVNLCLFWFHPLAWWLRRTLSLTAEQVCDEAALRTVGAPRAYIDVLRSMAVVVRARGGRYLWRVPA